MLYGAYRTGDRVSETGLASTSPPPSAGPRSGDGAPRPRPIERGANGGRRARGPRTARRHEERKSGKLVFLGVPWALELVRPLVDRSWLPVTRHLPNFDTRLFPPRRGHSTTRTETILSFHGNKQDGMFK